MSRNSRQQESSIDPALIEDDDKMSEPYDDTVSHHLLFVDCRFKLTYGRNFRKAPLSLQALTGPITITRPRLSLCPPCYRPINIATDANSLI